MMYLKRVTAVLLALCVMLTAFTLILPTFADQSDTPQVLTSQGSLTLSEVPKQYNVNNTVTDTALSSMSWFGFYVKAPSGGTVDLYLSESSGEKYVPKNSAKTAYFIDLERNTSTTSNASLGTVNVPVGFEGYVAMSLDDFMRHPGYTNDNDVLDVGTVNGFAFWNCYTPNRDAAGNMEIKEISFASSKEAFFDHFVPVNTNINLLTSNGSLTMSEAPKNYNLSNTVTNSAITNMSWLGFYVKTISGGSFDMGLVETSGEMYVPKNSARTVYFVSTDGNVATTSSSSLGTIVLPQNFEGYAAISFDDFMRHPGYANINGTLDLDLVGGFNFWNAYNSDRSAAADVEINKMTFAVSKEAIFDEFITVSSGATLLTSAGEIELTTVPKEYSVGNTIKNYAVKNMKWLGFYVKADNGGTVALGLKESSNEFYVPKNSAKTAYFIDLARNVTTTSNADHSTISIPNGFEGYIAISIEDFMRHTGYSNVNGTLDLDIVSAFNFWNCYNADRTASGNMKIKDISLATTKEAIFDHFVPDTTPPVTALTVSDRTANPVTGGASVNISKTVSDISKIAGFGWVGFKLKTTETGGTICLGMKESTGSMYWPKNEARDTFFITADGTTSTTSASSQGVINVLANFEGYVYMNIASVFTRHPGYAADANGVFNPESFTVLDLWNATANGWTVSELTFADSKESFLSHFNLTENTGPGQGGGEQGGGEDQPTDSGAKVVTSDGSIELDTIATKDLTNKITDLAIKRAEWVGFYIKTEKGGTLAFGVKETSSAGAELYVPTNSSRKSYFITLGGDIIITSSDAFATIKVPADFEGYMVMSLEDFSQHTGHNVENGVLDLDKIGSLQLWNCKNPDGTDGNMKIKELSFAVTKEDFIEKFVPEANKAIDALIVSNLSKNTAMGGVSVPFGATVSDLSKIAGFNTLGFRIKTDSTGGQFCIGIRESGGSMYWPKADVSRNVYFITKGGKVTVTTNTASGYITVPANFDGYAYMSISEVLTAHSGYVADANGVYNPELFAGFSVWNAPSEGWTIGDISFAKSKEAFYELFSLAENSGDAGGEGSGAKVLTSNGEKTLSGGISENFTNTITDISVNDMKWVGFYIKSEDGGTVALGLKENSGEMYWPHEEEREATFISLKGDIIKSKTKEQGIIKVPAGFEGYVVLSLENDIIRHPGHTLVNGELDLADIATFSFWNCKDLKGNNGTMTIKNISFAVTQDAFIDHFVPAANKAVDALIVSSQSKPASKVGEVHLGATVSNLSKIAGFNVVGFKLKTNSYGGQICIGLKETTGSLYWPKKDVSRNVYFVSKDGKETVISCSYQGYINLPANFDGYAYMFVDEVFEAHPGYAKDADGAYNPENFSYFSFWNPTQEDWELGQVAFAKNKEALLALYGVKITGGGDSADQNNTGTTAPGSNNSDNTANNNANVQNGTTATPGSSNSGNNGAGTVAAACHGDPVSLGIIIYSIIKIIVLIGIAVLSIKKTGSRGTLEVVEASLEDLT